MGVLNEKRCKWHEFTYKTKISNLIINIILQYKINCVNIVYSIYIVL